MADAKELEKRLLEKAMTEENIEEMNKVVKILNETKGLTGLKVVHIPSLFFYKHIAKNMRVVFIYRNPADVKASLYRRGISEFKLDWFENNNAMIAAYENMPKSIIVSYESLLEGRSGIEKAFKKIGFTVDLNVIKKGHRTQENSKVLLTEDEKRMYKFLQKLEKESWK